MALFIYRLIVTLQYSVPAIVPSEPIILERYFKFQVKKPLDVKTKLYNAEVSLNLRSYIGKCVIYNQPIF